MDGTTPSPLQASAAEAEVLPKRRKKNARAPGELATVKIRPLMLPVSYDNLTRPVVNFSQSSLQEEASQLDDGERTLIVAESVAELVEDAGVSGVLNDGSGNELRFVAPDGLNPLRRYFDSRRGRPIHLFGRLCRGENGVWLLDSPIPVPPKWLGRVRPVYDLPGTLVSKILRESPEIERGNYLEFAAAQRIYRENVERELARPATSLIETATAKILNDGLRTGEATRAALGYARAQEPEVSLAALLKSLHAPASPEQAKENLRALEVLVAITEAAPGFDQNKNIDEERAGVSARGCEEGADFDGYAPYLERLAKCLPFTLTDSQKQAVQEILEGFDTKHPTCRLISGDVGSGKTAVIAMAVLACWRAGGRVAVMLPGEQLAVQVHRNFCEWFGPDVKVDLVAGKRPVGRNPARICVGTTAMLTRIYHRFDVVVVDEQQRFARRQREDLLAENAHLLEATATCIPRSQSRVLSGLMQVSRIVGAHVQKNIHTKIWRWEGRGQMLANVRETVAQGRKVLVIFPAKRSAVAASGVAVVPIKSKSDKDEAAPQGLYSVSDYFDAWERMFPGRVRMCHGGLSDDVNAASLQAIRDDAADVLLSTTLVEVGLDIHGFQRVVVMQANLFGLSTLHQIRGRVARGGGDGYCDLYVPNAEPQRSIARALTRLQVLVDHLDGFEIAAQDLEMRGPGDPTDFGHKQTGRNVSKLFGNRIVQEYAMELAHAALDKEFRDINGI